MTYVSHGSQLDIIFTNILSIFVQYLNDHLIKCNSYYQALSISYNAILQTLSSTKFSHVIKMFDSLALHYTQTLINSCLSDKQHGFRPR